MEEINNENITTIEKSAISPTTSAIKEPSTQPKRNKMWWADLIVIIFAFLTSQFAGAFICILLGITPPTENFTGDIHTEEAAVAASEQARFIAQS